MSETHEEARKNGGNRGHTISITNPGRTGRVHSETSRIVESAMEDAMSDLQRLVDDGHATGAEIRESMWMYSDFKDAWDEWVEDGAS